MRIGIVIFFNIVILLGLLRGASDVFSYEVSTHKILNEKATLRSDLNNFLKITLGMSDGIETFIDGKKVRDWIKEAGALEDDSRRFFNHFHNPLKPWNRAGLDDTFLLFPVRGKSSLLWSQEAVGVQGWSWRDARAYYYKAFTETTQEKREESFAKALRALGQVMHLIVDSSVPAHVRNDAHPRGYHYETWASQNVNNLRMTPIYPRLDLLGIGGVNSVPITDFIDGDHYRGDNPWAADWSNAGLAEYTNAHFFSDDTIFADDFSLNDRHYFPHPNKASVDFRPWTDETSNQQYLREFKRGGIQHVVMVGWLYWYRQVYFPHADAHFPVTLDKKVYEDQAARLVPRAIGYSAKLLDYFFRGSLDAAADGEDGIKITNSSAETMNGTFKLYYDATDPVTKEEIRKLGGGPWSLTLSPGAQSLPQTLTEPTDAKEPGKYWLVFKGKLGAERESVVGNFVELKTIPFAFVIQEEVIAPASVTKTGQFGKSFVFRDMIWIGGLNYKDIHQQATNGRIILSEIPQTIALNFGSGKGHFYVNNQLIPSGVWHPGDTPDLPKTWRYEEVGIKDCVICRWNNAGIVVEFKGGGQIYQGLWSFFAAYTSTRTVPFGILVGTMRKALMMATPSMYTDTPFNYRSGNGGASGFFLRSNEQFDVIQWGGLPLKIERCFKPSSCRDDFEANTWDNRLEVERSAYFLKYERSQNERWLDLTQGTLLPEFPLNITGEVKRIYSPAEIAFLKDIGVSPIEYSITFK